MAWTSRILSDGPLTGFAHGAGGIGWAVKVAADSLAVTGGAQIASTTAGPGKGGDIAVIIANGVTLSGTGANDASGITASAQPSSSGRGARCC